MNAEQGSRMDAWGDALAWARVQNRRLGIGSRPALRAFLRYKMHLFTTRRVYQAERGRKR
jgi:hypothetical protein